MIHFTVEREIDVPVEKAWEVLSDFTNVHKVHPLVASVDQNTNHDRGFNAERTNHLYSGGTVTERVIDWREADRKYTIKFVEGSLPVWNIVATLAAVPAGEDKTRLVGQMALVGKYGLLGKILEFLALKPQFGKDVGNLFSGIERYVKTGKEVQKGYTAPTPALISTSC